MPNGTRLIELIFCLLCVGFVWWLGRLVYSYPVLQWLCFGGFAAWLLWSEWKAKKAPAAEIPASSEEEDAMPSFPMTQVEMCECGRHAHYLLPDGEESLEFCSQDGVVREIARLVHAGRQLLFPPKVFEDVYDLLPSTDDEAAVLAAHTCFEINRESLVGKGLLVSPPKSKFSHH